MADGYARVTNEPHALLYMSTLGHRLWVQLFTMHLLAVLLYLFLPASHPTLLRGEIRGSRTEFIHWLQDIPEQKLIVAQYCRYAAEIKTGKNQNREER
jgi:hypothetical protein